MEVQKRRRYSKEYRQDVVNIIKTGNKSIKEISDELEIPLGLLYKWYRKLNVICPPKSRRKEKQEQELTEKDKEIRELRKKLAEVMEERDILKKAINIFSQEEKTR